MKRSKALRLPRDLREEIERMWREGRFTLDDLMEFVRSKGADAGSTPEGISRSGLHRYLRNFEQTAKRLREAQEVAGAVVGKLIDEPRGDVGRLLQELLKTIAFQQLSGIEEAGAEVKPADLMFLAKALQSVESAGKVSAEREQKIRAMVREQLERKVDEMKAAAAGKPDAAATLEKVKEMVRGLL